MLRDGGGVGGMGEVKGGWGRSWEGGVGVWEWWMDHIAHSFLASV